MLFIPVVTFSQHTLFLSYQPTDRGFGLRYDYQPGRIGLYTSISRGDYNFGEWYVNNHRKAAAGILYKGFSAGVSYHKYGTINGNFNSKGLKPWSFEVGGKGEVNHLSVGIRFDFLKGEGVCDIGYKF
mgnify:CR=1 FL=1